MKKILLNLVAILQFSIALSEPITMPDETELQKRLSSIGMEHFAEKTNIIKTLAGQQKKPLAIAAAIELSMFDYFEYLKKGMPEPLFKMTQATFMMGKSSLLEALLKDNPTALKELEADGIYKPTKKSN
jgi:hypothetical protein